MPLAASVIEKVWESINLLYLTNITILQRTYYITMPAQPISG